MRWKWFRCVASTRERFGTDRFNSGRRCDRNKIRKRRPLVELVDRRVFPDGSEILKFSWNEIYRCSGVKELSNRRLNVNDPTVISDASN